MIILQQPESSSVEKLMKARYFISKCEKQQHYFLNHQPNTNPANFALLHSRSQLVKHIKKQPNKACKPWRNSQRTSTDLDWGRTTSARRGRCPSPTPRGRRCPNTWRAGSGGRGPGCSPSGGCAAAPSSLPCGTGSGIHDTCTPCTPCATSTTKRSQCPTSRICNTEQINSWDWIHSRNRNILISNQEIQWHPRYKERGQSPWKSNGMDRHKRHALGFKNCSLVLLWFLHFENKFLGI